MKKNITTLQLSSRLSCVAAMTLGAGSGLLHSANASEFNTLISSSLIVKTAILPEADLSGSGEISLEDAENQPAVELGELVESGEAEFIHCIKPDDFQNTEIFITDPGVEDSQPEVVESPSEESGDVVIDEQAPDNEEWVDGDAGSDVEEVAVEEPSGDDTAVDEQGTDEVISGDDVAITDKEEEGSFDDVIFQSGWYHLAGPHPFYRGNIGVVNGGEEGEAGALSEVDADAATSFDFANVGFFHHSGRGRAHFIMHRKADSDISSEDEAETQVDSDVSSDDSATLIADVQDTETENFEPVIDVEEVPAAIEDNGRVFLK